MIDAIAILLTHGLLLVAFWRMARRDDMDDESLPGDTDGGAGWRSPRP